MQDTTDIALVGAGPIGIEMAVALTRAGLNYMHIEAGNIGSTVSWYAPETTFFSSPERIAIAGVPLGNQSQSKTTREEYLTYLRMVVAQYKLSVSTYERVTDFIVQDDSSFRLKTERSFRGATGPQELNYQRTENVLRTIDSKKVILAIGDMHLPNLIDIPGESLPHVSHYLGDPHQYFKSKVLIVGGNNSAVEAAIRLARVGARVTISYRKEAFNKKRIKHWLYPDLLYLIRSKKITFLPQTVPVEITPGEVYLRSTDSEQDTVPISADSVLLLTGYRQRPDLFLQAGIKLHGPGQQPTCNPDTMETNISGIYVAGTAVAGTQLGGVTEFIETSHIHVRRIANHLTGIDPPEFDPAFDTSTLES